MKNKGSGDTIQELNQSPPDLSALDKTRDYSFLLEERRKLDDPIAELKNTPLRDAKSYQSSGTNLGGSPTTSLAKYATSTPAEVPSNLILSPSNNSQSDTFRYYRDSRDSILESPIKDITSTSNKQNNPSNISRVLSPLFDNNSLNNTDLLSTDNQLQKIQPREDEEQGLISEFKNLSLAKYATSTPAEVPANLILSPSNNSQSDTFRYYRDSRDSIPESPIKDITSTSNKQNNPSNISRVLSPLFDNNSLNNTDLLSTDNQIQKIQPREDEEQELISEFKNLSLAKYATSTPAEVPSNLILSPSNNSKSDTFRDYRDGHDPVLESPIKDITSTSNKQNNPSNISRALNPLFDNNGLKNTDLLSTDNQLQKIQPREDEEQELISEFKNLSLIDSSDLRVSRSSIAQLILPTTSMTSNTTHHRNKLKQLKQKHKNKELKHAIKRQEQRKKEEARIEAEKKQV